MAPRRTLLQELEDASRSIGSPSTPPFASSNSSPFDSSLALTILVLLTVLFFMAFFSLYIRRFSDDNNNHNSNSSSANDQISPRRRHPPPRDKRGGGLDPSAVRVLPVAPYGGGLKVWGECSICLSEFEEGETVKMIPYCRHGFHPLCIDTWLSSHASCPVCRSTRLFTAVDEAAVDGDPTVVRE